MLFSYQLWALWLFFKKVVEGGKKTKLFSAATSRILKQTGGVTIISIFFIGPKKSNHMKQNFVWFEEESFLATAPTKTNKASKKFKFIALKELLIRG